MAGALNIVRGTKMNVALDQGLGHAPNFDLMCTFGKSIDESSFLVSIPLKNGRPLELDMMQKLLFRYSQGSDEVIVAGYAEETVKDGIRNYWRIRRVQEQRTFFQRKDERFEVALHVEYMQDSWERNDKGLVDYEDGMTLDISAGGIAMYMNRVIDVGETVFLKMPRIGVGREGALAEDVVGVVCWMREAPKGSLYRHVSGFKFKYAGDEDKQEMQDYIEYAKNRYKLG